MFTSKVLTSPILLRLLCSLSGVESLPFIGSILTFDPSRTDCDLRIGDKI